ncbi:MAG: D-alanyl-D-alanine carboxypeptidase/D-alanyl-D-alanine-endopeptidase [Ignavibacteriales bacterium]|nr:D-alanyl-D-alanine carboxypeptidase/D-alanyl-D-alanine-endopeptidase [Ignavibacteriales bacterium]
MNKCISVLLLTMSLLAMGCSGSRQSAAIQLTPLERLKVNIAARFDDSAFSNAHWGVIIQSLKSGEVIYSRNEKKCFMPASNMKLFTTSAGLTALTPSFRYTTSLDASGPVVNAVLQGDLVLRGSGDPTISGRYNGGKVTETFEQWADSLKSKGIAEISGNIIGDDNCFDEEFYGDGWEAGYETDYYAAQFGGIVFNDNCIDVMVTPGSAVGEKAVIGWVPNTSYVTIINETVTTAADSNYYISFLRDRGTNRIHVRGKFPINKPAWKESIAIDNPTLFAVSVLKEVLEQRGIRVKGTARDIDELQQIPFSVLHLATYVSPSLDTIVKTINKPSQNLYAEQLFRTIGLQKFGIGSYRAVRWTVNPIFASWGMDTTRMEVIDGSGLSRLDLISPSNVIALLKGMHDGPFFTPFYASLPIAGVDGSIRNRMKGTKAENNVHAKTGFIGYVRALSGYVTSADGEMYMFTMIANNYTVSTSRAERIQNDICVMMANFSRN